MPASSSGKTTFAQRLSIQLKVNGLVPINISVDDYFVNKSQTPLDEDGNPIMNALKAWIYNYLMIISTGLFQEKR